MAEGKLMYHCSLALRLMSWTLVGKPMREVSFRSISSCITRYHEHDRITTWNIKNAFLCLLSSQWPKPSGRLVIGLACSDLNTRPITNRPQVGNPPHVKTELTAD